MKTFLIFVMLYIVIKILKNLKINISKKKDDNVIDVDYEEIEY